MYALQKVSGVLAQVLDDNGGAVQVAAGGTFCLALTACGKVVVWGKVPGQELTDDLTATLPLTTGGAVQGELTEAVPLSLVGLASRLSGPVLI